MKNIVPNFILLLFIAMCWSSWGEDNAFGDMFTKESFEEYQEQQAFEKKLSRVNRAYDEMNKRLEKLKEEKKKREEFGPSKEYLKKIEKHKPTKKTETLYHEDNGTLRGITTKWYRHDKKLIYHYQREPDEKGKFHLISSMFYYNGKYVCLFLIDKRNKKHSLSLSVKGNSGIDVGVLDTNFDGIPDNISFSNANPKRGEYEGILEAFNLNKKTELFEPISAKEYQELQDLFEATAPFTKATLDTIDETNKNKDKKATWENISVKPVYFNQTLLRDCASYLTKVSRIKIDLSSRLNKVNDLAIDLHLDPRKEYNLKNVLVMIIEFLEKEHRIKVKIKPVSNNHIILDLNQSEDADTKLALTKRKIAKIEKTCKPKVGTSKVEVEKIFGYGIPTTSHPNGSKDGLLLYRLYNNRRLFVRYDNGVVTKAYYNTYVPKLKGNQQPETTNIEEQLKSAKE